MSLGMLKLVGIELVLFRKSRQQDRRNLFSFYSIRVNLPQGGWPFQQMRLVMFWELIMWMKGLT
jgi:hypothetical protein